MNVTIRDRRTPREVAAELRGLLAFPLTPFTQEDVVDLSVLRAQVEQFVNLGVAAVFPACGTGEFPSLRLDEQVTVARATVEQVAGRVPVLTGTAVRGAVDEGRTAALADAGVDGLLVFPPEAEGLSGQEQLDYFRIAAGRTGLAVIPYQKDGFQLADEVLSELTTSSEIVGVKDGAGDLRVLERQRGVAPPDSLFINGTPTAELLEVQPESHGLFDSYSSALLNCMPAVALDFARARLAGDKDTMTQLVTDYVQPFVDVRDRQDGYAVSLVKAAARLRGYAGGPARPPLPVPTDRDIRDVAVLLERATRQLGAAEPLQAPADAWNDRNDDRTTDVQ